MAAGWNVQRMVWVADRRFASAANRAYQTRGGGHYIHAEKLLYGASDARYIDQPALDQAE